MLLVRSLLIGQKTHREEEDLEKLDTQAGFGAVGVLKLQGEPGLVVDLKFNLKLPPNKKGQRKRRLVACMSGTHVRSTSISLYLSSVLPRLDNDAVTVTLGRQLKLFGR